MARTSRIFRSPDRPRWSAPTPRPFWAALLLAGLTSCSSWREVRSFDKWTLYETASDPLEPGLWERTFEPAIEAVEAHFGPFRAPVAVHAWSGGVGLKDQRHTIVIGSDKSATQQIPGIGAARIQAWHARGSGFGHRGGIFIAEPQVGTAVHELVHAHYAEQETDLPLWFEEGVATLIGDGAMWNGQWLIDGLAYWPLRELREDPPTDSELKTLLEVRAGKSASVAENVSVHFVGWAIVFDLYVETGSLDWKVWFERFDFDNPVQDARRRMQRTLQAETEAQWLDRLTSSNPGRRLATARGVWKVRNDRVANILLDALESEEVPEIRTSLALNLLAGTKQSRRSLGIRKRIKRLVSQVFNEVRLPNLREQQAMDVVQEAFLGNRNNGVADALQELAPYWSE